jgi:EAL domain-containing protein (putative c-di-GMP-specific phosphodiesterase class I)
VAATETGRRPRWALPPQPPDAWIGGPWSAGLTGAVVVGVLAPVSKSYNATDGSVTALAVAWALTAVGAVVTAHGLLVEHSVRGDRRLRWMAAGFATAYVLLVARSLNSADHVGDALTLLLLAAVPLYALTAWLARRTAWLLLLPGLLLLAGGGLAYGFPDQLPDLLQDASWAGVAGLSVLSVLAWRGLRRPSLWVTLSLLVGAGAALLRAADDTAYTGGWDAPLGAEVATFLLPALGIGLTTSLTFWRQARQWHQLEADVRQLRRASPLLPGRSVTPDDDEGLPESHDVEALIKAGQVRVAIQPVVALQAGGVVGHEALSRFGGRVPTDRWFKAASKYNLGGELERLTLHAALQLLPALPAAEFLAVNVSPAALGDPEVVALLDAVDLSRVVVEITEHEAVADYIVTRAALDRLRRAGARIAVDDTGAGFASLRHVLMLQPDVIKLDTSLTRGIETDKRQQDLVRAVTVFGAQVGAAVLAEGIETQGQLDQLRHIGVHLGQGWHLGVPVLT